MILGEHAIKVTHESTGLAATLALRNDCVAQAFDLVGTSNTRGALSFAHFAKGGIRNVRTTGRTHVVSVSSLPVLSLDEIVVSFFLIGRDNMLPLEIWGRLRRSITPEINAISTIILLLSLIAIVFRHRLRTRAEVTPEIGTELFETVGR